MKKLLIYGGIGLTILIVVVALKKCNNKLEIEVTTEKAAKRTIIETVSANGKIQPEVEVKISSDVSGQIVELPVKEGDMVKKGDLLARINPEIYQSTLERVNAALNTARANYSNSQARLLQIKAQFVNVESVYKRNKQLFDQGVISQADYDNSISQYEGGKADVDAATQNVKAAEYGVRSAEASLREATENLSKTTITAPVNGKIIKLSVEQGERVVGTSQMSGTEMMVLASSNEMEVNVDVNENDIIRVHLNDTALIEVDAYASRKFKGIVTEIANSANTTGISADQVTNFVVKIRMLQSSYMDLTNPFRRGMSATVDVQTKHAENAITVPIQAVTTRSDSTINKEGKEKGEEESEETKVVEDKKPVKEVKKEVKEYVFILADGKAKQVEVKTGIQDNSYIEITQGIKEGQEVISGPYTAVSKLLKDGNPVKIAAPATGKEK